MTLSRSEIIKRAVYKDTLEKLSNHAIDELGIDALTLSLDLELHRSNVSMELNKLWKDGALVKVQGRPTLFFDNEAFGKQYPNLYMPSYISIDESVTDYISKDSPLGRGVNVEEKVSEEMRVALSAMAYPPNGLSLFIYGDAGVGKAKFVHELISICKQKGILARNSRVEIFDCRTKQSLEGFDLLETNHTLFVIKNVEYLNDDGYNALLEILEFRAQRRIQSDGKSYPIIVTTSEKLESKLVQELLQIIPMDIYLPNMEEIPPINKVKAIVDILKHEANSVEKNISININIFTILCAHCYTFNRNSAFSEIQNAIASAYYNDINSQEKTISITFEDLSVSMRTGKNNEFDYNMLLQSFQEEYVFMNINGKSNIDDLMDANLDELHQALLPLISNFKSNGSNLEYEIRFLKDLYYVFFPNQDKSRLSIKHFENLNALRTVMSTKNFEKYNVINDIDVFILYTYLMILNGVSQLGGVDDEHNDELISMFVSMEIMNEELNNELGSKIINSLLVELNNMNQSEKPQLLVVVDDRTQEGIYEDLLKEFDGLTYFIYYADRNTGSLESNRMIKDLIINKMSPVDTLVITDIYSLFRNRVALKDSFHLDIEVVYPLSLPLLDKCVANLKLGYSVSDFKNINIQRISDNEKGTQRVGKLDNHEFVGELDEKLLMHDLTFMDSRKSTPLITESLYAITEQLNIEITKSLITKYLIHCSFMLERVIRNESLTHPKLQNFYINNAKMVKLVKLNLRTIEESYGITIPPMEIAYISEIFQDAKNFGSYNE